MSQTLYLLRHAKSVPWEPGDTDFDRSLSQRGRDHMQRLSSWMRDHLDPPGAALCSSSRRTRETISPILGIWPQITQHTSYLDEIYEASTGTLHALAERAFETADSVLMVGHNPGFEYLAIAVLRDSDAAGISKMATGTLAVIEFPSSYGEDSGQGILRQWIRRKSLL